MVSCTNRVLTFQVGYWLLTSMKRMLMCLIIIEFCSSHFLFQFLVIFHQYKNNSHYRILSDQVNWLDLGCNPYGDLHLKKIAHYQDVVIEFWSPSQKWIGVDIVLISIIEFFFLKKCSFNCNDPQEDIEQNGNCPQEDLTKSSYK